jgi:hypothetical protein
VLSPYTTKCFDNAASINWNAGRCMAALISFSMRVYASRRDRDPREIKGSFEVSVVEIGDYPITSFTTRRVNSPHKKSKMCFIYY